MKRAWILLAAAVVGAAVAYWLLQGSETGSSPGQPAAREETSAPAVPSNPLPGGGDSGPSAPSHAPSVPTTVPSPLSGSPEIPEVDTRQAAQRLEDPDPDVRLDAVSELLEAGQGYNEIETSLRNEKDEDVRLQIVDSLANFEEPRAQALLIGALRDESPAVRGAVAQSLGFVMEGVGFLRALEEAYDREKDEDVRAVIRESRMALGEDAPEEDAVEPEQ